MSDYSDFKKYEHAIEKARRINNNMKNGVRKNENIMGQVRKTALAQGIKRLSKKELREMGLEDRISDDRLTAKELAKKYGTPKAKKASKSKPQVVKPQVIVSASAIEDEKEGELRKKLLKEYEEKRRNKHSLLDDIKSVGNGL